MANKKRRKPKPGDPDYKGPVHELLRPLKPNKGRESDEEILARKATRRQVEANNKATIKKGEALSRMIGSARSVGKAYSAIGQHYASAIKGSLDNKPPAARRVTKRVTNRATKPSLPKRTTVSRTTGSNSRTKAVGRVAAKVTARTGLTGSAARKRARTIVKKRGR